MSSTVTGCSPRKRSRRSPRVTASGSTTRPTTSLCDWGLGFAIDAYGMGRHASPRTFGHGGALSAISFADPEHGLVAVMQTNGMCSNDDHYLRLDAVTSALYEDLDLVPSGAPGRDKPFPTVDLSSATPKE